MNAANTLLPRNERCYVSLVKQTSRHGKSKDDFDHVSGVVFGGSALRAHLLFHNVERAPLPVPLFLWFLELSR
jgi:hypothetical protein